MFGLAYCGIVCISMFVYRNTKEIENGKKFSDGRRKLTTFNFLFSLFHSFSVVCVCRFFFSSSYFGK